MKGRLVYKNFQRSKEFFYNLFIFVYTLLSLSGNLGRLTRVSLQQLQEQRYAVLQVHAGSFHVFVIHPTLRNPPNSDMDYRIFKRAYVIILMRACTHRGLGTHRQRVSTNISDSEKLPHKFFLCSWRRWGSNLRSLDFESDTLPTEPPPPPVTGVTGFYKNFHSSEEKIGATVCKMATVVQTRDGSKKIWKSLNRGLGKKSSNTPLSFFFFLRSSIGGGSVCGRF